jgi:fructose-1,6-bisphosphatase II
MIPESQKQAPERNLALELVRVTEASALAAARWQGRGDREGADAAATEAMRVVLNTMSMNGAILIGKGPKEDSPVLYTGERVGTGEEPPTDVAAEPIEGSGLLAQGRENAISIIAISERGTMFDPGPCKYMDKIVVGPDAVGVVDIDRPPVDNVKAVAKAKGEHPRDITVVVLDRPRHSDLIAELRSAGARIRLIQDGDVAGALSAVWSRGGADMLMGIGGTSEGVITAAAIKCMGGELQGRLWARNNEDRQRAQGAGYDLDMVRITEDFVRGDNCFVSVTGITDGNLIGGVRYTADMATTKSLVMRSKSGTVRTVEARHRLDKLAQFSEVDYE